MTHQTVIHKDHNKEANQKCVGKIQGSKENIIQYPEASLVAQMVKNLPALQETWIQSLGQEDPLEKGLANHSSILAWKIQWTEEPGGLQSMVLQRVRHD